MQRLLDWVESGGHLLVRTPPWTRRPREAQAWGLLERLGVQPVGAPGQCASLHIEGQSPHVEFCRGQRFVLVDRTPELRWQAEARIEGIQPALLYSTLDASPVSGTTAWPAGWQRQAPPRKRQRAT